MRNQHVAPSRPEADEPLVGSARRAGAAPAKSGLPRDWPPAAKVRGELARAVGFSRRQFEGRSGPAGSVALALLMAPDRATSPAGHGVTRWTLTDRASLGSRPLAGADERMTAEPDSELRLPRAVSTPEFACAPEQAETPRWNRPLVDRALTAVASTTRALEAQSHSDLGAPRWHEQSPLSWEPAGVTVRGQAVERNANSDRRAGPLTSIRNSLQNTFQHALRVKLRVTLPDTVANHLRRAPQTALSRARRAFASCEQLVANAWPGFEAGTSVRRPAERAEVLGTTGGAARGQADAPNQHNSATAIATSAELATSEWASAAVFTSLLALLFML